MSDSGTLSEFPISTERIQHLVELCIHPSHFYEKTPGRLTWKHLPHEETSWEIFQGRLLDASHTRLAQTFESWNVYWSHDGSPSDEPLISVKLSIGDRQLHVVRAIHCYAWEGYHDGDNVYLSREVPKWVRELVGTIDLNDFTDEELLRNEIAGEIFLAIAGTSRLPVTSVESPLPGFSLGEFAYFPSSAQPFRSGPRPVCSRPWTQLLDRFSQGLDLLERTKLLDTMLRSADGNDLILLGPALASRWQELGWSRSQLASLLRNLFNEIALSPYAHFVEVTLEFVDGLVEYSQVSSEERDLSDSYFSREDAIDFQSYLLRQNARHLTAYDLFIFHHRGANYPDALLLDEVLQAYLNEIEENAGTFLRSEQDREPEAKRKRLRRRALRQALVQWHIYQGLPVPDYPTSPGENTRILPAPFIRVPEEQILNTALRTKKLFADSNLRLDRPAIQAAIRHSVADLCEPDELQELGLGVYADRPFGHADASGEPDRTPLFAYELFSPSVMQGRLRFLEKTPIFGIKDDRLHLPARELVAKLQNSSLPLRLNPNAGKPGVISLEDAAKMASDFVVLRMTSQSRRSFFDWFDFASLRTRFALPFLDTTRPLLIIRANVLEKRDPRILLVFDGERRRRMELEVDLAGGFQVRMGIALPRNGLRVLRMWTGDGSNESLQEHNLIHNRLIVTLRR
jgi:hypothetical protein